MLNECEQLWASRAAQALDARLTNHVVAPSVNPALHAPQAGFRLSIPSLDVSVNLVHETQSNKLTVEGQTGGQSEAHIDILPCNSFQHSARHSPYTLYQSLL